MKRFLALQEKLNRFLDKPIGQAVTVYLFSALLSFMAVRTVLILARPAINQTRSGVMLAYARILQSHPSDLMESKSDILPRLTQAFGSFAFSIWLVDSKGSVVSSTSPLPLPVDWTEIPQDSEEYSIRWVDDSSIFNSLKAIAAVKLVNEPERHLVFHFASKTGDFAKYAIGLVLVLFNGIFGGIAVFVYFLARRRIRKAMA